LNTVISIDQHRSRLAAFLTARLASYWVMIKGVQTGLLIITALAGYASGCCLNVGGGSLAALITSLFLSVAGCTVLNMVYDRDIDAIMQRTANRPLPCNLVYPAEAMALGIGLTLVGVIWAFAQYALFGMIVLLGVVFDVLVYTVLLKRRTPYSILFGGLAGGMPVLAGRVLAIGSVDLIGILLAVGVLLWIPTHIMTFTLKYRYDYSIAGVPIFPDIYGVKITRMIIATSTILAVLMMAFSGWRIGVSLVFQVVGWFLGVLLISLVMASIIKNNKKLDFVLYKGASIYMLGTMLILIWGGL
jgi:protoheme IX farnesyltransferase